MDDRDEGDAGAPSRDRGQWPAALTVCCVVLGVLAGSAVALVSHFASSVAPHHLYAGRYVPLEGTTVSEAYSSTLSVSFDPAHPGWWPILPMSVGGGLVLGVVTALVLRRFGWTLVRRR